MNQARRSLSTARGCGPVAISLPPDPELVSAIRLTASGMAASAKCTIDTIDDIKLAVSEVLLALIEHGSDDELRISLELDRDRFRIIAGAATENFDADHPDLALCRVVLAEVCAEHSIDLVNDALRISASVRLKPDHDS